MRVVILLLAATAAVAGADLVELGRRLFHDRRLSRDGSLSCATCHDPGRAFADDRAVAHGIGGAAGTRNAPALINRAGGASFFWDGRVTSLEEQVLEPITNPKELGLTLEEAEERLGLKRDEIARALAGYVRSIRSGDSPFDRHVAGAFGALSPQEQKGLELFNGRSNCWVCHSGVKLTDELFHNTGIAWRQGRLLDEGRFAVTRQPQDRGAFKTPTLREVSRTAPYMHDGSLATLEAVIDYYDRGGNPNPGLHPALRPLRLSAEEKRALAAFLHSLTGRIEEGR